MDTGGKEERREGGREGGENQRLRFQEGQRTQPRCSLPSLFDSIKPPCLLAW